ncbi:MAG: molybdopterin cofactor-binding domain-containing protein [Gemmatimonadales bacterium]
MTTLERREFLRLLGAGGLLLAVGAEGCRKVEREEDLTRELGGGITPVAYIRLDPSGTVVIICHRSEMGQGIRTTVPMILADEMDADWKRVKVEQALGDHKTYGNQLTDGSTSIREQLQMLREAGATVRDLLERAAATHWQAPREQVEAQFHEVIHKTSGRRVGYGELVKVAQSLPAAPTGSKPALKDPAQFRYIGKEMPGVDLRPMTTGTAVYGQDLHHDGMKVAVIARPPVYGGQLASVDSSEAEKVPGVLKVIRLPKAEIPTAFNAVGGVAVVASNTWAAIQGRSKLTLTWDDGPNATYDSAAYRAEMEASSRKAGKIWRKQGDAKAAIARSAKKLSADYYIPHLSHAQMEPPAALAVYANDAFEIWAPTQDPQGARDTVAQILQVPVEKVTMHVTLLGGAFGRKGKADFIVEAALLAKEIGGAVKVVWTRDDDIQHGYYHAVAAQHLEAGLDQEGKVTGWLHRSVLPSINSTFAPNVKEQGPFEMGMGITDFPYPVEHFQAESGPIPAHVRIGWFRSVINIPHAFAISSFIDELAHEAGKDPKDFLLGWLTPDHVLDLKAAGVVGEPWNYGAKPEEQRIEANRYRGVIEAATKSAGWGEALPAGEGRGLAVHRSFWSYVAVVARVKVGADGVVSVPRVDIAIDAGFIANPERVRSQMEGAVIMGMSNTLYSDLTFAAGRVVQSNYTDYRITRMTEAPREIVVTIVPSDRPAGGAGEPGLPPVGAALCNAIFAATGKRIRTLPVADQLKPAMA